MTWTDDRVCFDCSHNPCVCRRFSPCACGTLIIAGADMPLAMRAHQRSPSHRRWRAMNDPWRRWPTADGKPVDGVQGDVGASADGAEGAA